MPKKFTSAWLMGMVIEAQSIPQLQSGQQNLNIDSLEDDLRPCHPADIICLVMINRVETYAKRSLNKSCRTCFRMWYF